MELKYIKLYLLCILVGAFTGIVTIPYHFLLGKASDLRNLIFNSEVHWWVHLLIIFSMWVVGLMIHYCVKKCGSISGSGIPQVEGAIYGRFRFHQPFKALVLKFTGGLASIGMGLSLGREGPSVQMGAFVARLIGKWTHASVSEQRYLYTGGASAGLSSAFIAPLASSIFIVEELEKFDSVKIIITSLLASTIAGTMAGWAFPGNLYAPINAAYPSELSIVGIILTFILFSLLLSLVGKLFNYCLLYFQQKYSQIRMSIYLKVLSVVIVTYIIGYFFSDLLAGGEDFLIKQAGTTAYTGILFLSGIVLLKLLFTALSYSTGFPGGIFLPLLVIGGLTGKVFALVLVSQGDISVDHCGFFMAIGMAAAFAAVVRSPVTGIVLLLEMTHKFELLVPMTIVVGITYFISDIGGVKPLYDQLYLRLLPKDTEYSKTPHTVSFEVNTDSYLQDKRIENIILPKDCKIEKIIRKGIPLPLHGITIQPGDQVDITLPSCDLEKLYRTFRNMANE